MKKKLCKKAAVCFCAAEMAFQGAFASYGAWQANKGQWQYSTPDTKETIKASWYQVDGQWYWFDRYGIMRTGWHLDTDGQWYFLNPISDGTKGKMMTGWQWIDGHCYYLSEKTTGKRPLGAMYAGERTPDGYKVDKNGAWTDDSGFPVYKAGKGIITAAANMGTGSKGRARSLIAGNGGSTAAEKNPGIKQSGVEASGLSSNDSKSTDSKTEEGRKTGNDREPDEKAESDSTGEGNPTDSGLKAIKDETGISQDTAQDLDGLRKGQVHWKLYFTDLSAHQLQLAPSKSGTVEEGTDLTIYFQTKIVDSENRIWKSLQKSPYIITVTGPQDRIIYVEYEEVGKAEEEADPWKEEKEHLQACMEHAKKQEALFLGTFQEVIPDSRLLAENKDICDMRLTSAAGRIEPGEGGTFFVIGKNYIPEGSVLAEVYGDDMEYSNTVEDKVALENDIYILSRFQLYRKPLVGREEHLWSANEKQHWEVGDVQQRELDGVMYRFRCIDQNYGDETDRSRQKALFLCDTVIPADRGSSYSYEKGEDGTYGYQFYPGPLVCFGDSNSYKYSHIRKWLKNAEVDFQDAAEVSTGVSYAYEGSTKAGSGKEMLRQELKASYIGSQAMTDRLFILSVDEAIKYGPWLWKFGGAEEENPESQQNSFCKSYWLRNPSAQEGEGKVYVVDLISKNIHPQKIKPEEDSGDKELNVTGTTGVRPAYTVRQK